MYFFHKNNCIFWFVYWKWYAYQYLLFNETFAVTVYEYIFHNCLSESYLVFARKLMQ